MLRRLYGVLWRCCRIVGGYIMLKRTRDRNGLAPGYPEGFSWVQVVKT
jgi:hypothetical protein